MVTTISRLIGGRTARSMTVLALATEAWKAFSRGRRLRAAGMLVVAALAWKWALLGLIAHGLVKLFRR